MRNKRATPFTFKFVSKIFLIHIFQYPALPWYRSHYFYMKYQTFGYKNKMVSLTSHCYSQSPLLSIAHRYYLRHHHPLQLRRKIPKSATASSTLLSDRPMLADCIFYICLVCGDGLLCVYP